MSDFEHIWQAMAERESNRIALRQAHLAAGLPKPPMPVKPPMDRLKCRRGHLKIGANAVRVNASKGHYLACRICINDTQRRWHAKRRASKQPDIGRSLYLAIPPLTQKSDP